MSFFIKLKQMYSIVCRIADCYVIIKIIAIWPIKKTGLNNRHHYIDKIIYIYPILDIHAFHLIGYINDCTYKRDYRRITHIVVKPASHKGF